MSYTEKLEVLVAGPKFASSTKNPATYKSFNPPVTSSTISAGPAQQNVIWTSMIQREKQ